MRTITVKLCNPTVNILSAVAAFLSLLLLLGLGLSRYLPISVYPLLSLVLAGILSGLIARYLSQGPGKVDVDDKSITITSHNSYLNRDYVLTIAKEELNAFEIYKDKFFTKLVLYKYGKPPKSYTLIGNQDQESELIGFLKSDLRYLDRKNNLSALTFWTAFFRSFGMLLIVVGCVAAVYLTANWLHYSANKTVISVNIIYWLLLPVFFLVFYNRFHYKNNFRVVGRNITWFFILLMSLFLFTVLLPASYSLFQRPIHVESLSNNILDNSHKFIIPKQLLLDTTQIGYYYTAHTGSRSKFHTLNHFFTTPVIDPKHRRAIDHHVFIGRRYKQNIRKNLSIEEKTRLRLTFLNSTATDFKIEVAAHPAFYEVLYHQNNSAFRNKGFLRSALSARHTKSPLIVVVPHKESFEEYQSSSKKHILIGSLVAIVLLVINGLTIAFNR